MVVETVPELVLRRELELMGARLVVVSRLAGSALCFAASALLLVHDTRWVALMLFGLGCVGLVLSGVKAREYRALRKSFKAEVAAEAEAS